ETRAVPAINRLDHRDLSLTRTLIMSKKRILRLVLTAQALVALTALPARASFISIAQPNLAYLLGTQALPIAESDFSAVSSLTDGTETVDFDFGLVALTVPLSWSSWGAPPNTESSTPRVLWTNGLTSLEMLSSLPLFTFGFEAQPNTLSL